MEGNTKNVAENSLVYLKEAGSACATMLKLFYQTYWTRVWIIQEIVLAKRISIRLGKDQINWDEMTSFCTSPPVLGSRDTDTTVPCSVLHKLKVTAPRKILQQRKDTVQTGDATNTNKNYQRPLFELLQTYQQLCCSDVRDKVFGLRSLSLPYCRQHSAMDYSQTSGMVLKSVLLHYFFSHQDVMVTQNKSIDFYNTLKSAFTHFGSDDIQRDEETSQDNTIQAVSKDATTTSVIGLECYPIGILAWDAERKWCDILFIAYEVEVTLASVDGSTCRKTAYLKRGPRIEQWKFRLGAEAVLFQVNNLEYLLLPEGQQSQPCKLIPDKRMSWDLYGRKWEDDIQAPLWLEYSMLKAMCQLSFTVCNWHLVTDDFCRRLK